MKILLPLIICLLVASMNSIYPAARAAQTTTIYQVTAPSGVIAGGENPLPVAVIVYYNNTVPGYHLVVGILDAKLSPQGIVPGVVVSSTSPCVNQPGMAALCAITVPSSSGVVRIGFQIGGIFGGIRERGNWDLNVTSVLEGPQNNLIPSSVSSKLFKVDFSPVALNVNVPSNRAVSADHSILAVVALGVIAALIIAFLLLQRRKRPTTTRKGPKSVPKHSISALRSTNAQTSTDTLL